LLDYLETQVNGPFLVGGAWSLAGLSAASPFASLALADDALDRARWPRFCTYAGGILGRPALASIRD
jgi:glutathione S-transferase